MILRESRHQAQFDLRIVRRDEPVVLVAGDKSLADEFAALGPYRDILQIGVGRTQSAGFGEGLLIGGMDASIGVDQRGKLVDVG